MLDPYCGSCEQHNAGTATRYNRRQRSFTFFDGRFIGFVHVSG